MKIKLFVKYQIVGKHEGGMDPFDTVVFQKTTSTATLEDLTVGKEVFINVRPAYDSIQDLRNPCKITRSEPVDSGDSILRHIWTHFEVVMETNPEGGLPLDGELAILFSEVIPRMKRQGYEIYGIMPSSPRSKFYDRPEVATIMEEVMNNKPPTPPKTYTEEEVEERVKTEVAAARSIVRERILDNIQQHLITPMLQPLVPLTSPVAIIERHNGKEYPLVERGELLTQNTVMGVLLPKTHRIRCLGMSDDVVVPALESARELIRKLMGNPPL